MGSKSGMSIPSTFISLQTKYSFIEKSYCLSVLFFLMGKKATKTKNFQIWIKLPKSIRKDNAGCKIVKRPFNHFFQ